MNPIRWLKDVVEYFGGTSHVVQTEVVGEPHFKRVHISFQVSVRDTDFTSMSPGESIPMVSIAVWGQIAPNRVTLESTVMEACIEQLKDHGYFVPDLSYFRIKQLEEGEGNVIVTTERLCRLNQHDMVCNILLSFF